MTCTKQLDFLWKAPPQKRSATSKRHETPKRDVTTCVVAPISRASTASSSSDRRQTYHFDDAFEDAIQSQIDALDDIDETGEISKMTTSVYATATFGMASTYDNSPALPSPTTGRPTPWALRSLTQLERNCFWTLLWNVVINWYESRRFVQTYKCSMIINYNARVVLWDIV